MGFAATPNDMLYVFGGVLAAAGGSLGTVGDNGGSALFLPTTAQSQIYFA
jgi:hypothetical protein